MIRFLAVAFLAAAALATPDFYAPRFSTWPDGQIVYYIARGEVYLVRAPWWPVEPIGTLDLRWFGITEQPDTGLKRGHDMAPICVTDGRPC